MNDNRPQTLRVLRAAFVAAWIAFSIMGALYTCRRPWGIDKMMGPLLYFFQTEKFPAAVKKQVRIHGWAPSEAERDNPRPLTELIRTASPGHASTKANSLAGSYSKFLNHICNNALNTPRRFIIVVNTYDVDLGAEPVSTSFQACIQGQGIQ